MNRNLEYQALLLELDEVPAALEHTVDKAMNRRKTLQRKMRSFGVSAGSLAACFAVFVVMVNAFPTFAKACEDIPVLSALAEAVSFSPSLSAAVENEYVQAMNLVQTENGVTASVEHVIVDRKQVSVFFALDSSEVEGLEFDYDITSPEKGYNSSTGSFQEENGELRRIDVNFMDVDVPDTLGLSLSVYAAPSAEERAIPAEERWDRTEQKPDYLAEFDFTLEFDPYFTAQGEVIPVDRTVVIDGQRLTLTEVEVYPTHLRVNLEDDPDNTAWLQRLELYLENERGERFESGVSGISASGDPDGEGMATFWLDSPFFSQGEELTLYITGAAWQDKEMEELRVDLKNQTVQGLPEAVRFQWAKKQGREWWLSFAAPKAPEGASGQLFEGSFRDEAGNEYHIMQWSHTIGCEDPETGERVNEETMYTNEFPLEGLVGDVAYLTPYITHYSDLSAAPASIPIK